MIPLVTDLNRSATMTHQLNDTTPEFEVGDRVRLKFRAGHECDGRMATVKGPQGTDGLVPVELDRSPYNTSVQRVRPIRLNNP